MQNCVGQIITYPSKILSSLVCVVIEVILCVVLTVCVIICGSICDLMYVVNKLKYEISKNYQMYGRLHRVYLKKDRKNFHWHFNRKIFGSGNTMTRNMWHNTITTMSGKLNEFFS